MNRTSLARFILNTMCWRESGTWQMSLNGESILSDMLLRRILVLWWQRLGPVHHTQGKMSHVFLLHLVVRSQVKPGLLHRALDIQAQKSLLSEGCFLSRDNPFLSLCLPLISPTNNPAYCPTNSFAGGRKHSKGRMDTITLFSDKKSVLVVGEAQYLFVLSSCELFTCQLWPISSRL